MNSTCTTCRFFIKQILLILTLKYLFVIIQLKLIKHRYTILYYYQYVYINI